MYAQRKIIAECLSAEGIKLTLFEGLNFPEHYELVITLPQSLYGLFEDNSRLIYEAVPGVFDYGGTLYFAEDPITGVVRFFAHNTRNQSGFGGSVFKLPMKGGEEISIRGPWSSRCSVMNDAGFEPSKEVTIQGKYRMASAMTVKRINELLYPVGWQLERDFGDIEKSYEYVASVKGE